MSQRAQLTDEQCRNVLLRAGVNLNNEDLGEIRIGLPMLYSILRGVYSAGGDRDLLRVGYKEEGTP